MAVTEATDYTVTLSYMVTVNITGQGDESSHGVLASVGINGTTYYNPATVEVDPGTTITLYVKGTTANPGTVTVNGVKVIDASGYNNTTITPESGPVDITLSYTYTGNYYGGVIVVTYPT